MRHLEPVPVDERWLGLDKRGFPTAIVAIVLIAVLAWIVPAVSDSIEWENETVAGDVLDLGGGITVTPPVGWQLEEGIRTSEPPLNAPRADGSSVRLANGATVITVRGAAWEGTAGELMDQNNRVRVASDEEPDRFFEATSEQTTVTTASGVTGVSETFTSATGDGVAYAFVVPTDSGAPIGIVIEASTPDDSVGRHREQIDELVSSLSTTPEPAS